jgi:hypothetical protein
LINLTNGSTDSLFGAEILNPRTGNKESNFVWLKTQEVYANRNDTTIKNFFISVHFILKIEFYIGF